MRRMKMNYASIDIGTNSCRLLISEVCPGQIRTIYRDIRTTRIGEGLSISGNISEEAAERTLKCLLEYQEKIKKANVGRYRTVATSAVREAANRLWFEDLCRQNLEQPIEVISGEEEARLTYRGVQKGLEINSPLLVCDLGGGSTELIYPQKKGFYVHSLSLGAVRGTELRVTEEQILSVVAEVKPQKELFSPTVLVFCGGTATSVVAMKYGLTQYECDRVHGQRLCRNEISRFYEYLTSMPIEERRRVAGLQAQRADIIVTGLMIMLKLMSVLGKEWALVSESDLQEGVIWAMALDQSDIVS